MRTPEQLNSDFDKNRYGTLFQDFKSSLKVYPCFLDFEVLFKNELEIFIEIMGPIPAPLIPQEGSMSKAENVIAQVVGGSKKILDNCETVGDVKKELGCSTYTANVNGEPASDDDTLSDGDFVTLAKSAKGGN